MDISFKQLTRMTILVLVTGIAEATTGKSFKIKFLGNAVAPEKVGRRVVEGSSKRKVLLFDLQLT